MKQQKKQLFSDQIREAVDASRLSRYEICKQIDMSEATMSRFMNSKGFLSESKLNELADLLRLTVRRDKRRR